MIGDTMETDILGGVQMGYRTILTLTGGTRREDLIRYAYRPDAVIESVGQLDSPQAIERLLPHAPQHTDTPHDLSEWVKMHS
jgi:NagD protein